MGIEMSLRNQRVGTSHSDRMRADVSLEYVMLSKRIHIPLRTSENFWGTWRSVWVGWVGGISFRCWVSLRCRAWRGVYLRDLLSNIGGIKNWKLILIYKCNKYCLKNFYYENLFCRNITIIKFKYSCSFVLLNTCNVFFNVIEEPPHLSWRWWFGSEIVSVRWLLY